MAVLPALRAAVLSFPLCHTVSESIFYSTLPAIQINTSPTLLTATTDLYTVHTTQSAPAKSRLCLAADSRYTNNMRRSHNYSSIPLNPSR